MCKWIPLLVLVAGCAPDPTPRPELLPVTLQLDPPPVDQGMQVAFGPFAVPQGTEVQLCRTMKLPNDQPAAINRLQLAMNVGSHHFIIFRSSKALDDAGDVPDEVFPCWGTVNFDDWEFVMDVNKAGGNDWQLGDGQAFMMKPHQQIMIQAHFVNATTVQAPVGGMALLNLWEMPPELVTHKLYGLFSVDTDISIPPNSPYTTHRLCTFDHGVYMVAMTGHFHARGLSFLVDLNIQGDDYYRPPTGAPILYDELYKSTNWDSPLFEVFDPPMRFGNGASYGVDFTCNYYNGTDQTIGWGGHADVQEHCNLFMQYYNDPEDKDPFTGIPYDGPIHCVQGSGGW
jgi:hypothetical protein